MGREKVCASLSLQSVLLEVCVCNFSSGQTHGQISLSSDCEQRENERGRRKKGKKKTDHKMKKNQKNLQMNDVEIDADWSSACVKN